MTDGKRQPGTTKSKAPAAAPTKAAKRSTSTSAKSTAEAEVGADAKSTHRTTFYLPPEIRRQLRIQAAVTETTMNGIVIEAINEWLDRHPFPGQ